MMVDLNIMIESLHRRMHLQLIQLILAFMMFECSLSSSETLKAHVEGNKDCFNLIAVGLGEVVGNVKKRKFE